MVLLFNARDKFKKKKNLDYKNYYNILKIKSQTLYTFEN